MRGTVYLVDGDGVPFRRLVVTLMTAVTADDFRHQARGRWSITTGKLEHGGRVEFGPIGPPWN